MGSVLWMDGVGLGLARNIVQRYALEPDVTAANDQQTVRHVGQFERGVESSTFGLSIETFGTVHDVLTCVVS